MVVSTVKPVLTLTATAIGKSDVFGTRRNIAVELYCVDGGKTLMMIIAGQTLEETQEVQSTLDKKLSQ